MEKQADPQDLAIIQKMFGSCAQTLINSLLACVRLLGLVLHLQVRCAPAFLCPVEQRETHAFKLCRAAIDMHECFERVGIRRHKSFLPHGAIFKIPREILRLGNTWAVCCSSFT